MYDVTIHCLVSGYCLRPFVFVFSLLSLLMSQPTPSLSSPDLSPVFGGINLATSPLLFLSFVIHLLLFSEESSAPLWLHQLGRLLAILSFVIPLTLLRHFLLGFLLLPFLCLLPLLLLLQLHLPCYPSPIPLCLLDV